MTRKIFSIIAVVFICLSSSQLVFAADVKTDAESNLKSKDLNIYEKTLTKHKNLIDKVKIDKDFKVIVDDSNGNASFTNNPNVKTSKKDLKQKLTDYSAQTTATGSLTGSNSKSYSDGKVYVGFSDDITCSNSLTTNCKYTIEGSSFSDWSGSSPYYASSIDQSDIFTCYVNSGSLQIGWPPSISPTRSGNVLTLAYPELTGSYYRYDHFFNGITFEAWSIEKVNHCDAATYRFGSTTVSTSCSADAR